MSDSAQEQIVERKPVCRYEAPKDAWICPGCDFSCIDDITLLWFARASSYTVFQWLINHGLTTVECDNGTCQGSCSPISLDDDEVGLICYTCRHISVGGRRGIWRYVNGHSTIITVLLFFIAAEEMGISSARHMLGNLSTKDWMAVLWTTGMVCGEAMERDRRNPDRRYTIAQIDETPFGTRKKKSDHENTREAKFQWVLTKVDESRYTIGQIEKNSGTLNDNEDMNIRKSSLQWALTCVDISASGHDKGKPIGIDVRMLPYNKNSFNEVNSLATTRLNSGGKINIDCWLQYSQVPEHSELEHFIANDSEAFKGHDQADAHKKVVKKLQQRKMLEAADYQFSKLPYLTRDGHPSSLI